MHFVKFWEVSMGKKDVIKEFIENRIEENIEMFSSKDNKELIKKIYLLGFKDGIELRNHE